MTIQTVEQNNILCAVINSDEKVFTDVLLLTAMKRYLQMHSLHSMCL